MNLTHTGKLYTCGIDHDTQLPYKKKSQDCFRVMQVQHDIVSLYKESVLRPLKSKCTF